MKMAVTDDRKTIVGRKPYWEDQKKCYVMSVQKLSTKCHYLSGRVVYCGLLFQNPAFRIVISESIRHANLSWFIFEIHQLLYTLYILCVTDNMMRTIKIDIGRK